MIIPTHLKDKTVAVLGLGKSGLSTVRALKEAGAIVWAWDDNESARNALKEIGGVPINLNEIEWRIIDLLVMSPGIAHTFPKAHPVADLARAHDCPIICDVELLIQTCPSAKYIAITGTNGKSTTTALVHHVLDVAGIEVEVGGNFGIPALDLEPLNEDGVYVLELSSYQLERVPSLKADVAVWLNISPDHLDRHGGLEGYIAAKENIFKNQTSDHFAIIGVDDEFSQAVFNKQKQAPAKTVPISAKGPVDDGIFADEDILIDEAFIEDGQQIMDLSAIKTLPGQHNQQNAAAAYACGVCVGADPEWIVRAIASFPGLAHRQEFVTTLEGVNFVNDSKATNADAASKALGSYDDIFWIAGGVAKDGGIESLVSELSGVRKAYLIGEAASNFAQTLEGKVDYALCDDLQAATTQAFMDAKAASGMVLLSPACASFDQFKSFEARGDAFKSIVQNLSEEAA